MNPKQRSQGLWQPLLLCVAMCLSAAAAALPADKAQNMKISSGEASIDSKQGVTILIGPVKITQGTLEINADKVTLRYDNKHNLESLVADGLPARFQQQLETDKPLVHAEADKITYTLSKDHLTLDKNAFVEQNGATTRGGRIDYDMTSGTVHATGGTSNGVEFVIPPQLTEKKE